ncbi:MAG: hypothetical protein AB1813_14250 [Verrucomicrobiota bacterium]
MLDALIQGLALPARGKLIPILFLVGLTVTPDSSAAATIEGTVKLSVRAGSAASAARYQARGAEATAAAAPVPAVVYLEGNFPARTTNAAPVARLSQKNLQFIPRVLAIQKGTRVEFPNEDDEYHNVLSYSKAKEFDLGRYRKDEKPPAVLFDKPGVVELDCEIHSHMRGTIVVLDSPHFTVTDVEGKFRLTNLPAGKFTLKARLDAKTTFSQEVELTDGTTIAVHLPAPAP